MMKGLIFDLDGTLLDSMPAWNQLLDNMLLKRGITPPPDLLDRTKTLGLENATSMVLQEFGLTDDPAEVYQMFQNEMEYLYCNTIPLKPGVQEFLDAMKGRLPMAVATATSRVLVEKVLEHHHLTDYFHSITTVAEVGIGKHDPKVFLTAAEKLNFPASECVVFEDSLTAIRSANTAGFHTVAIYEASNLHEQDMLKAEANWYIKDFNDIIKAL
ncbi:MAG: HAD family phosphatase [Peptococcaceae bacterium]|nr:HAD family phosphatase [Peptococcaceae bacterium]MBQ2905066.1 HAD family phosphatase [Peptococcaceae bacterium]